MSAPKKMPFNRPVCMPAAFDYMRQAVENGRLSGDGEFTQKCSRWMEERFSAAKVLLTTSGTHALELAARLCGISPGDEVIMPSYTFSSTANAFVAAGARIRFVDIRPDTMNMDEQLVEAALTPKTRAIVPMHYAGVACEMDTLNAIAERHGLAVVEDAAQGIMASYKGAWLGALSPLGCFSFHETKNFNMGEGGALLIRDAADIDEAEIIREKGTDRSKFFRGQVDKYSWVDWGSSYLPSELNAAFLWAQLEQAEAITQNRLDSWNRYHKALQPLAAKGRIELQHIPQHCVHNAHMFYLKAADLAERTALIAHLKKDGVQAVYHYVPLHSARAGRRFGSFVGEDRYTTRESERLLRLPLYYGLEREAQDKAIDSLLKFYKEG